MKFALCNELLMPQGSHFLCFAKESNQRKATPGIRLIPAVLAFRGMRWTSCGRDAHASPIHDDNASWTAKRSAPRGESMGIPVEPQFDRFAMGSGTRMRASGLRRSDWPR